MESSDFNLPAEVLSDSTHSGGATRTPQLRGGKTFTSGFSVAEHPERTSILPLDDVSLGDIERWIEKNGDLLNEKDNTGRQHAVGAWIAPMIDDGGKPYGPDLLWLDVATVYPKDQLAQAIDSGIGHNQQAIWDFEAMDEIPTGGTGVMKVAPYSERRRLVGVFDPSDPQFILDQIRAAAMQQVRKAKDGDGDGFVNDGTPSQRPVGPSDMVSGRRRKMSTRQKIAQVLHRPKSRVVKSATEALDRMAAGEHVELDKNTLSVMLNKLQQIGADAYAKKQQGVDVKVPDYDLCRVHLKDTNIFCQKTKGIPRIKMPQLSSRGSGLKKGSYAEKKWRAMGDPKAEVDLAPEFIQSLEHEGIKITDEQRDASKLKATQDQIIGANVGSLMQAGETGAVDLHAPIFISRDGYILDGHHRWSAAVGLEYTEGKPFPMNVRVIDLPIMDLVDVANTFAANMGIKPQSGSVSKGSKQDPNGGLTAEGRKAFGGNLKPGVKNYAKASPADKKRWISWALRFYGQDQYPPLKKPNGEPTRFALTAAAWGEPVPSTEAEARAIAAKARKRQSELDRVSKGMGPVSAARVKKSGATDLVAINQQEQYQRQQEKTKPKKALTARQIQQRRLAAAKRKRPKDWNGRCYNRGYAAAHPEECGGNVKKGDEPCCEDCAEKVFKEDRRERKTQKALTARQIQQRRNAAAKRRKPQQDERLYRKTAAGWAVATRGYAAANPDKVKTRQEIEKKKGKGHSDAWLASHPSPLSTPKEIVGHHGHRPHGPSIRWPALYEHLRKKGMSKSKAAAISNAGWKKKRMGIPTNTSTSVRGVAKAGGQITMRQLSPAEVQQRRDAAKARWSKQGQAQEADAVKALAAQMQGMDDATKEKVKAFLIENARKRDNGEVFYDVATGKKKLRASVKKDDGCQHDKLKAGRKCKVCGKVKRKVAHLPVKGDEQQTEVLMKAEEITKFPKPIKVLTEKQRAQRRHAALKSARRRARLRHKGLTAAKDQVVRRKHKEERRNRRKAADDMRQKRRAAWKQQRASAGKALQMMADEAVGVPAMQEYKVAPFSVGKSFDMSGTDEDKQLVFGWAYVTHDPSGNLNVDKSGDFVEHPEELEDAAYDFVLHSRRGGLNHERTDTGPVVKSTLVESVVITPEKMEAMGIPDGTVPTGWWVGFRVEDPDVWSDVKDGKYASFSIHGSGVRSQVQL